MRTKHLLWTMALPALFAACQSEDVFDAGQVDSLAGRKVLNDITFTLNGAETRFDRGESGWEFSASDAFGACLVDVYSKNDDAERGAIDNYLLSEYIQTNYQYAYNESTGTWSTPARMVEGNYVFYAPFNEAHLSRGPVDVVTPVSQQLDVNADGSADTYSVINDVVKSGNPFFVTYAFLSAENQPKELKLSLMPIFAMPEVTIKNEKTTDVTIKKFVVKTAEDFAVKAPLNVGTSGSVASAASGGVVGNFFNVGEESKDNAFGAWVNSDAKDANYLVGETTDVMGTPTASTNIIVVEIPEGLTIKAGGEEKFNIVMPAKKYAGTTEKPTTVYAYINDEEGYSFEITDNMTFRPNKRYPQEEYINAGSLSSKAGSLFTAKIAKTAEVEEIGEEFPVVVSTTAELVAAVKNGTKRFKVIPTSDKVAINAAVVDAMRQVNFQGMVIEGDIRIEGGAGEAAALTLNEDVEINGTATVSGYVVLDKSATGNKMLTAKTVKVGENGDLTIKNAKITNLENAGHVTIAAESTVNASVKNNAKGTLDIDGTLTTSVENSGTVNVNANYSYAGTELKGVWNVEAGVMTLEYAATVAEDAGITVNATLTGAAVTIAPNGTMTVAGRVENAIELNGYKAQTTSESNKPATLNVNDGAFIKAKVGAASNNTNANVNIMNVQKGTTFFNTPDLSYITSTYTYTGTITKGGEVPSVPEGINIVKINGGVTAMEAYDVAFPDCDLIITGNVESKAAIELGANGKKLTVNGYVEVAGGELTLAAKEVEIKGALTAGAAGTVEASNPTKVTLGSLNIANTTTGLTLNAAIEVTVGAITSKANIDFSAATNIELKGNILMAENKKIEARKDNKIDILSNVTLEGELSLGETEINVWGNKTLTIAQGAEISADTSVAFKSQLKASADATTNATKRGQVVNNGTVSGAAEAYDGADDNATEATGLGWWSGDAATK